MSIESSITIRGSKCRCAAGDVLSFNWDYAQERNDDDLSSFADCLVYARKLKFGHLYRCRDCDSWWYLGEEVGAMMSVVPASSRLSLEDWNASKLIPSSAQIAALKEIGGGGADSYGNGSGSYRIPCQVTWADGTTDDPCLVIVSKNPPRGPMGEPNLSKHRLFRDVFKIRPTKFALSREIRLATLNSNEISMGYSPTCVESADGRRLVLNWTNELFQYENICGQDLKLSSQEFSYGREMESGAIPVLTNAVDSMIYVYCDWFDGCETLAMR